MPSRRKLIGRKLERRVVGQATLLALLQPAAEAGCVALELCNMHANAYVYTDQPASGQLTAFSSIQ